MALSDALANAPRVGRYGCGDLRDIAGAQAARRASFPRGMLSDELRRAGAPTRLIIGTAIAAPNFDMAAHLAVLIRLRSKGSAAYSP